eukprot:CAMPEP_0168563626 /NCGR_PEP_ID=MMETSP0413-20121227/12779_1 /TAXON_ID=136452 /ORGANISM="Filamoeba nolandi, Strain NC-AS-23-1" /LENGTH=613 /DNA_ID=CAMNT_0008595177 /DNA_START=309 /DNA_END=2152 /DNA_ORIENTATION=+
MSRFQMKDREQEIATLANVVYQNFFAAINRLVLKKSWYLPAIAGGSGTDSTAVNTLELVGKHIRENKSTFEKDIEQQLANISSTANPREIVSTMLRTLESDKARTIHMDFFPEWNKHDSLTQAFLFTLMSKILFPNTDASTIRTCITDSEMTKFTLSSVAQALRKHLQVADTDYVTIAFIFDEFQRQVSPQDLILRQTAQKEDILVRQMAKDIMSVVSSLARDFQIFIVPIFAGTLSTDYMTTDYTVQGITLGPLELATAVELVSSVLEKQDIPKLPRSLIDSMGGIPRALEYLVDIAVKHPSKPTNPKGIFNEVVTKIGVTYGIRAGLLSSQGVKKLVQLCLVGYPATMVDKIEDTELGQLHLSGIVFLQPIKDEKYQVTIPLVFAAAWNNVLHLMDSKMVTYRPILKPTDLEWFGRDFEVFKNNFLLEMGIEFTTFGERFAGALMSDDLKKTPLRLQKLTGYNSKEEQPPKVNSVIEIQEGGRVDLKRDSVSVWFGRNCTSCDTITTYPNQQNNTIWHFQEWKGMLHQQVEQNTLGSSLVIQEREQACTYVGQQRIIPSHSVYFTFFTNKDFNETGKKRLQPIVDEFKDTMIVSQEQFKQYFSSMSSTCDI